MSKPKTGAKKTTEQTLTDLCAPRMTPFIKVVPTAKQQAALRLDCEEVFYGGRAGGGKALSVNALVYTPFGPRRIGDLDVGDIICSIDGHNTRIIGVFPQGKQKLFRVEFYDGGFTYATAEHIWKYSISRRNWKKSGVQYKLALTHQLATLIESGNTILIPLPEPVQFTRSYRHDYRQIPPYVLGVLLGDGSLSTCTETTGTVRFSSSDIFIKNKMKNLTQCHWYSVPDKKRSTCVGYGATGEGNKNLRYWLSRMKLTGTKSVNKFVPEQYKFSSVESRFELLQGLLDTDGTVSKGGKISFSSKSKQLAQDVRWIVLSLGGRARISTKRAKYRGKDYGISYSVHIQIKDSAAIFSLPRKKARCRKFNGGVSDVKRKIKSIKYSHIGEAVCIKVDNADGLFLTDDFIVTHNTVWLLAAALQYVDVPGYNAVLIRDTYQNMIKPEGILFLAHEWLQGTEAQWSGMEKAYYFPVKSKATLPFEVVSNKATLGFGYLNDPMDHFQYQGPAYQFIGFDEVVGIRENQFKYVCFSRNRRRIQLKNVPMRIRAASNPPAREQLARGEWVKRRYVDPATREPGVVFIPAGANDNPHIDVEAYDKMLDKLDPITRAQLKYGDWEIRAKGSIFDRTWFTIIDKPLPDVDLTVRYWDKAATEPQAKLARRQSQDPDYTVGVKMSRTRQGFYVIEHVARFRRNPGDTETYMRHIAEMDGIEVQIYEEEEGGSSGKVVIAHNMRHVFAGFAYKGVRHSTSKYARAKPLSTQAEGGNVYIVKGPWITGGEQTTLNTFFDEFEIFPDGEHDDIVDAASGAYEQLGTTARPNIRFVDDADEVFNSEFVKPKRG